MRISALILAACAASTLNWTRAAQSTPLPAAAEQRLPHIIDRSDRPGRPVVLIPGLPRRARSGTASPPSSARDHRLILVQVNGFAGDDPGANLDSASLAGIVDDLHGYLAANRLGTVRVIGHSMGGLDRADVRQGAS